MSEWVSERVIKWSQCVWVWVGGVSARHGAMLPYHSQPCVCRPASRRPQSTRCLQQRLQRHATHVQQEFRQQSCLVLAAEHLLPPCVRSGRQASFSGLFMLGLSGWKLQTWFLKSIKIAIGAATVRPAGAELTSP